MPRPTINDVAALAGVSKKTVSFVLNGRGGITSETRERVNAAIAQLGFSPSAQARSLARGEDASVVLALASDTTGAIADVVRGAWRGLAGSGLVLILAEGESGLATVLRDRRPRGVIVLGDMTAVDGAIVVSVGGESGAIRTHARQAAADAARYLQALGHRRIALAAGPEDEELAREHEMGLADAIGDAPLLVANGDGSLASGREAVAALLDLSPAPSAALAASAEIGLGVMRAARERGLRVPEDFSVIALADGPLAEYAAPPLTAMRHDWGAIAEQAVRLAVADASQPRQAITDFFAALVARGSVAAMA